MKGKHILIYGERGSGKTDIIDRITEQCTVPVYGFCTRIVKDREDGSTAGMQPSTVTHWPTWKCPGR